MCVCVLWTFSIENTRWHYQVNTVTIFFPSKYFRVTLWPWTGPCYHPTTNKEPLDASFACKNGLCWHDRPIHQVSKRPFCIRQRRIRPRRQSQGRYQSTSTGPEYNAGGSSYESNLSKQVVRRIWILPAGRTDGRTRTGRLSSVGGKSALYKTDWQTARAPSRDVKGGRLAPDTPLGSWTSTHVHYNKN